MDVLQKLRMHISRNMNAKKVVEVLYSQSVLDMDDREEILSETTTQYKVLKLLDKLSRRGPKAFDAFLQALRNCGFEFLVDDIQRELSGKKL